MQLIENTIISDHRCVWCDSFQVPHSRACPLGERYKQVQEIGGVPVPEQKRITKRDAHDEDYRVDDEEPKCLDCGASVSAYSMTCDECAKRIDAYLKANPI